MPEDVFEGVTPLQGLAPIKGAGHHTLPEHVFEGVTPLHGVAPIKSATLKHPGGEHFANCYFEKVPTLINGNMGHAGIALTKRLLRCCFNQTVILSHP